MSLAMLLIVGFLIGGMLIAYVLLGPSEPPDDGSDWLTDDYLPLDHDLDGDITDTD